MMMGWRCRFRSGGQNLRERGSERLVFKFSMKED